MQELLTGILNLTLGQAIMFLVGGGLIYLAIRKQYEPALLLPIGFGAILANVPLSAAITQPLTTPHDSNIFFDLINTPVLSWVGLIAAQPVHAEGVLSLLFDAGIRNELFPLLIFVAVGAMIDFGPLLSDPLMLLFGAAAQVGIFATMCLAALFGFTLQQAASIGIIGAADGPTSIVVAGRFAPELLGPISVAAYSYMALVPIIQPPVIRALTSPRERTIRMHLRTYPVSRASRVLFPVLITLVAGVLVPSAAALVGFLMFGNLLREAGVVDRLARGAQNELANIVTILLGLAIGGTMVAHNFLRPQTLLILAMGLAAFVFDTAGGVLFAKIINVFLPEGRKLNPMVGACGISAFPMSARVVHRMAQDADPQNVLLMHAVGANVGGQIGSVIAGGMILGLVAG